MKAVITADIIDYSALNSSLADEELKVLTELFENISLSQ